MLVAVVDFGSNSTRLLIADFDGGGVREIERISTVTRLGEGVDANGTLSQAAIDRVLAAVDDYAAKIASARPARVVALATSAVREASNRESFTSAVREHLGHEVNVIPGEREAELTFSGAVEARSGNEPVAVVDIGGGSTEIVVGEAGRASFVASTKLGTVRQTERHLRTDPPTDTDLAKLRDEAQAILRDAVPPAVKTSVRAAIAVAGTPTSLASIDQQLDPYDPERVEGYTLSLQRTEQLLGMLAAEPLESRQKLIGLQPDRAYTIVAGAAILAQTVAFFGLGSVHVSERDLLYGAAREAIRSPGAPTTF